MKTICVVTSTRADYGIFKPLLTKIQADNAYRLHIVATGMHLAREFGETYQEIEKDGFAIHKKIDILVASDTDSGVSKTMGLTALGFADYFEEHRPDLLLLLGDRYEIMTVATCATAFKIPIAHLHGGEITEGAIDDAYRHSISKMSFLHFTSCEEYRKRVIQLGESPDCVFNVGALGVENSMKAPLLSLSDLGSNIDFPLAEKEYFSVTFHPVTMEQDTAEKQVKELLAALDQFPAYRFVISKANSDAGGRKINALLDQYVVQKPNVLVVTSLGMQRYLSLLKYAAGMIGNSSSGIIEGPASKIPTINIGDRQKGRVQADSILNCEPVKEDIVRTIQTALSDEVQNRAKNTRNPYGNGDTSNQIMQILKQYFQSPLRPTKQFYDIEFEV